MWNRRKKRKINPKTGKREYRKKTPLRKLEDRADELTKEIVRLRASWICQKCDKHITNKSDAHRAHIVSRSHKILRWDLLNLLLLCFHCHQKSHSEVETKDYIKKKWPVVYEYLFIGTGGAKPLCNQTLPYRTLVEREEWMSVIISGLIADLMELKGK